jgi:hypothetical protein
MSFMSKAQRRLLFSFLFGSAFSCASSPDLSRAPRIEMRFGKKSPAKTEKKQTSPTPRLERETPDPPPISSRRQLQIECVLDHGQFTCLSTGVINYAESRVTPRTYGRFVLEAYADNELVERLHFNFPLAFGTGQTESEVEKGLVTKVNLEFPELPWATKLVVKDRQTGKTFVFPEHDDTSEQNGATAPTNPPK